MNPTKSSNSEQELDRKAVERLHEEQCSCVVRNGETMRSFHQRGVSDLWRLLHEEPDLLRGAFIADKVVGKGAAALMAAGDVRGLYARTVSRPALDLLAEAGIPVEQLCADARTPEECLPRIAEFIRRMKEQHQTRQDETNR